MRAPHFHRLAARAASSPGDTDMPKPTLTDTWNDHMAQEFVHRDVDATLATMTADPRVICVPVGTGGRGRSGVRDFYARHFIGRTPADLRVELLSRTADDAHVVDEMLISFTHDIELPWILPGVEPTGRRVELAAVGVIGFRDGKIEREHIYWDQASVLVQVGVLARARLPVTGVEQVKALIDPTVRLNALSSVLEER
jgi:carboxymethylenebutenolidase